MADAEQSSCYRANFGHSDIFVVMGRLQSVGDLYHTLMKNYPESIEQPMVLNADSRGILTSELKSVAGLPTFTIKTQIDFYRIMGNIFFIEYDSKMITYLFYCCSILFFFRETIE